MKIAICDDSAEQTESLKRNLSAISKSNNVKIKCDAYQSGEELAGVYKKHKKYDVIFLDMEMGGLNGIETANIIRKTDENVIIIFVTGHTQYMRESFKCQPFRFLVKPVEISELESVFNDIRKKLSTQKVALSIIEKKAAIRIACEDIIYCESYGHCVLIHTKEDTYKTRGSLSVLYEKLDSMQFCRVHSSYIVNFNYVKYLCGDHAELSFDGTNIPISRSYRKTVSAEFTKFIEGTLYI